MFTPIHLLPQYDRKEAIKYNNRWHTPLGKTTQEKIEKLISQGPTNELLDTAYFNKQLKLLENSLDLKGIELSNHSIVLNGEEGFVNIDFSYAVFKNITFKNINFKSTNFVLSKFINCKFIDCIFSSVSCYASTFEEVTFTKCDFFEFNRFRNCELKDVKFDNCFFTINIFFDCQFEERTRINIIKSESHSIPKRKQDKKDLAEIFKSIKEGYISGDVINRSREYYFKERQAITRYNIVDPPGKLGNLLLEIITGYGVKPMRVFATMITVFSIFSALFIAKIGFVDGLLLSGGAFFTNGVNSQFLASFDITYNILYIVESFTGILLMTIFITVLANLWFREK